jgi:hypothetical protein
MAEALSKAFTIPSASMSRAEGPKKLSVEMHIVPSQSIGRVLLATSC